MRITPRLVFLAIFLACAGLIGTAIYMQEQMGLEPCPMCILQRYAFVAIGLAALVAALHGPRAGVALKIYASTVVLFALVGGGTAIRQSWLQHNPPKVSQSCGQELEFYLETFPLSQALPKIFAGSGDCAEVKWKFLGLSIPEWALAWFVLMTAAAIWIAFVRRQ